MRSVRRIRVMSGLLAVVALVHGLAVFALPYLATHVVVDRILTRTNAGANELIVAAPRDAGADLVPMENPDTVTAAAWLDLDAGPQVLELSLPSSALYASISVYAHHTDTEFLLSDRDLPEPQSRAPLRVLILRRDDAVPAGEFTHVARISTRRAFLLVRAVLQDRYEPTQVERVVGELRQASLRPAR